MHEIRQDALPKKGELALKITALARTATALATVYGRLLVCQMD